jgi:hypothetical protein
MKLLPVIVTTWPAAPLVGLKEERTGAASVVGTPSLVGETEGVPEDVEVDEELPVWVEELPDGVEVPEWPEIVPLW